MLKKSYIGAMIEPHKTRNILHNFMNKEAFWRRASTSVRIFSSLQSMILFFLSPILNSRFSQISSSLSTTEKEREKIMTDNFFLLLLLLRLRYFLRNPQLYLASS